MPSTFFGLNIGQTGLYAYRSALDTTAHNITNTETEGYTRQVMGQKAGKALQMNSTYGMAGTGVSVTGVQQLRDEYYDMKYWKNNTISGEYASKSHYMSELESYFNEVSVEGFVANFDYMFNSLQELSKNPASLTVRTQVINYAKSLTEYFNSMSQSLQSIQEDCNFEIRNKVEQINSTAQQIAALTKQINTLEVNGGTANDLRDQRALLVDELSEIVNISVTEKVVGAGIGITSYVIKINGQTLVDGGNFNYLQVIPREVKMNQNDISGLYDIVWQNGQKFDMSSPTIGGALQALFEVRDGNNQLNLRGKVNALAGDSFVMMTETNINDVNKLNIPTNGMLTIGNRDYKYSGFEVNIDPVTGAYSYIFELEEPLIADADETPAAVGKSINYKGIPYYMDQMNEFIRTFAKAFNDIHRKGQDANNQQAIDFFNASHKINGRNYVFGPYEGSDEAEYYDYYSFNSQTGSYYEDVPEDQPLFGSYYFMTAANFTISTELLEDPKRLATATNMVDGQENNDIVDMLIALKTDKNMFKQGSPSGYMQILVADIGIDTRKALNLYENQQDILATITNQRLSVSGVDLDEETMNLVKFQNAYNLSAKVISVMDEIYDRLINYMGA
jgi:flagellar hook-associated protein 1 FlgK